ncbi:hypothetical protein PSTT_09084, partial [Puccinia striiformis]
NRLECPCNHQKIRLRQSGTLQLPQTSPQDTFNMVLHSDSEHSWRSSSSNDDPEQSSKNPDSSEHGQSDSEQQVSKKGEKQSDKYGWSDKSNEGPKPPNEEHERSEGSQEEAESSHQWLEHSDESQEEATSFNRQQDNSDEYQEDAESSDWHQESSDEYQEEAESSNRQQEDSGEYKEDTDLSDPQQEYSDKYQEDESSEPQQEYSEEEADLSDQQQEHSDVEHERADDELSDEESDDFDGKSDRSDDKSEESNGNLGLSDEEVEKSVCLDPNEVLTTDYSEISGSDDDTLSNASHLDTSSTTQSMQGSSPENSQKKIDTKVQRLFRFSEKNMIFLLTYNHYLETTKNGNYDIPPPPPPLLPHVRASILSSHSKGLNLKEIQARLSQETDIQVCIQTVKRYLKRLNVKLLANNVADGTVTMEQVFEAVDHARQSLLHDQAGYRRMRGILMRQYDIQIPRLLFLSLWIPIFQSSVDMCIDAYNLTRRRRDHLTSLPTACTADFCYSTPKSFATTGQLVPVPANKLNLMIVKDFPDCVEMFQHTPVWFDQLRHRILKRIGIKLTDITVGTVWTVFHQMLPLVEAEVDRQSCSPSD